MALPRPSRPASLWADIKAFASEKHDHRLRIALAAIAMPTILLLIFIFSPVTSPYQEPDIVFVQQWPKGRTDAEVRAQQAKDAPAVKAAKDAALAAAEEQKRQYKRLADSLGIEVDK